MTITDRVHAFAKLLGFDKPLFDNVDDALTFIDLAKDNTVMKQFPLYLEYIEDKVHVGADATDEDCTSMSTALTWSSLSKYDINATTGIVNKL